MITDFRQIKAGAPQRANGGYLVINAQDMVTSPLRLGDAQALTDGRPSPD
jgi:predicted ATP-dependent protease